MDLLKKGAARAQQSVGEAMGHATKTELDAGNVIVIIILIFLIIKKQLPNLL
jgi:hypothetical protein